MKGITLEEYKKFKILEIDTVFFNRDKIFDFLLKSISSPVIFDVGANIGQSVDLFKEKSPNSKIHSFEPDSEAYDSLQKNVEKYENVYAYHLGVGAKSEKLILNRYDHCESNSFIPISKDSYSFKMASHKKVNAALKGEVTTQETEVVSLDDFCKSKEIPEIDLLKVDVQGFENEVLKGAKILISQSRIKVIIVEVTFDDLYANKGNSFYELESNLIPFGYSLYDISHIYKNLSIGKTCWVDAVYISNSFLDFVSEGYIKS